MATVEPLWAGPLSENLAGEIEELGSGGGGTGCLKKALYAFPQVKWGVEC